MAAAMLRVRHNVLVLRHRVLVALVVHLERALGVQRGIVVQG